MEHVPYQFLNSISNSHTVLTLSGPIGDTWFSEGISAKKIKRALDGVSGDVTIKLNSPGGDVFEGIEIYNYLKSHSANITIEVTALAASAASLVAMGADKVVMLNGATMMIHEASTFCYGNKTDIKKTLNALETIDQSIIDIYKDKTNKTEEELRSMLEGETWLTADEAVAQGFADERASVASTDSEEVEEPIKTTATTSTKVKNKLKLFGGK